VDFFNNTTLAAELCRETGPDRQDVARCATWDGRGPLPERPPPVVPVSRPVPPPPSAEACAGAEQQEDWLAIEAGQLSDEDMRNGLRTFYKDLPACMQQTRPMNVPLRLRCVGREAGRLDEALRVSRQALPKIEGGDATAFCTAFRQESRAGNVMDRLKKLQTDTDAARARFEASNACMQEMRTWLQGREGVMNRQRPREQARFDQIGQRLKEAAEQAGADRVRIDSLLTQVAERVQEIIDDTIDAPLFCPAAAGDPLKPRPPPAPPQPPRPPPKSPA
jgi:hypothetical protein